MESYIQEFERTQSNLLRSLKMSTDLTHLEKELVLTEKSMPDCAAESLHRTNKISILKHRIKELNEMGVQ
jgi:hypothetical protein